MALIESTNIPLGTQMPEFTLNDPDGNAIDSHSFFEHCDGLIVAFTCNHCPYALAVWPRLIRLAEYAQENNIATVAINPNINPEYPEDSPEVMKEKIDEWDLGFPYLVDADQSVAKAFKAQCTPDIYLFDKEQKLLYHGRVDDNWKDEDKVKHHDLQKAVTRLIKGQEMDTHQKPSIGCSIKWC